jgi:hypothetical protein
MARRLGEVVTSDGTGALVWTLTSDPALPASYLTANTSTGLPMFCARIAVADATQLALVFGAWVGAPPPPPNAQSSWTAWVQWSPDGASWASECIEGAPTIVGAVASYPLLQRTWGPYVGGAQQPVYIAFPVVMPFVRFGMSAQGGWGVSDSAKTIALSVERQR